MKIIFSNMLIIHDPVQEVKDYCKNNLVLINPEYENKIRLGYSTRNVPKNIYLYYESENVVCIPYGEWSSLMFLLRKNNIQYTLSQSFGSKKPIDIDGSVELYDYQQTAVKVMLKAGYGILKAPAGSGKTQMGVGIVLGLKCKTLWLTHTKDLLKQSFDRFALYMDKMLLGTITEGKMNIGEAVTFATVQTLATQDLNLLKYEWDCIIVDECHRCAGSATSVTQFSKVLNNLAARHKFGLSATVHRADGLIRSTYALLGRVAYEVPEEAVKDKIMPVSIKRINTNVGIPDEALDTDGTLNYSRLINCFAKNEERNKLIAGNIDGSHSHLILSDRILHLHLLYEMLPDELKEKAAIVDGQMTTKKEKEARAQAIEDMRTGKKSILFASYKLAKEGLDIPRLDRLHLATPQKDYAVIVQSVGRIARSFKGKKTPVCFDYVDKAGMFEGMYKKRCTSYRKCGCKGV